MGLRGGAQAGTCIGEVDVITQEDITPENVVEIPHATDARLVWCFSVDGLEAYLRTSPTRGQNPYDRQPWTMQQRAAINRALPTTNRAIPIAERQPSGLSTTGLLFAGGFVALFSLLLSK